MSSACLKVQRGLHRRTHCSDHLTAVSTTSSSCCRVQEEFYISVFWKKRICPWEHFTQNPGSLPPCCNQTSGTSTIRVAVPPEVLCCPQGLYLRIFALSLDIAATASSWVANSTSASPVTLPSGPISMCTLTGFRGEKNYIQNSHTD